MNKFERIMLTAAFALAIVGSVFAVAWHQVLKLALPDLDRRIVDLRLVSAETAEEFEQTRTAIKALQGQCKDCGKCCCPKEAPKCGCCNGCPCAKDGCACARGVGKCGAYACKCGQKQTAADLAKLPEFSCFLMIQISDNEVWFKWVDVQGGEHETRMTLEEFERLGDGHEKDE